MKKEEWIQEQYRIMAPHLNERQRRLLAASSVKMLAERGAVTCVARATELSRATLYRGMAELESGEVSEGRIRREGGGRKTKVEKCPEILHQLESLVQPLTRGDPMSPLRWTCKSTRTLAGELCERGFQVGYRCVAKMLGELGYRLQANAKTLEGGAHPDRDGQFQHINEVAKKHLDESLPVISVDAKKKELVGQYRNNGHQWRPQGEPEHVNVYDFVTPGIGKAIPYGIYDIGQNLGWVNVGTDHDTASFAVQSILKWWRAMGNEIYPHAGKILICADGGGSNGHRLKLWKTQLQRFSNETGLAITVCHFPPGTSKWNKIEHRLFSHISMNWRGQPLISHDVIVQLISATKTSNGLSETAVLDTNSYPLKVKASEQELKSLNINRHEFHGKWNYFISPQLPVT